jgi:hypothetical protein
VSQVQFRSLFLWFRKSKSAQVSSDHLNSMFSEAERSEVFVLCPYRWVDSREEIINMDFRIYMTLISLYDTYE